MMPGPLEIIDTEARVRGVLAQLAAHFRTLREKEIECRTCTHTRIPVCQVAQTIEAWLDGRGSKG